MFKKTLSSLALCASVAVAAQAAPISEDVIQQSFYPYAKGKPTAASIQPGMVISSANVDAVKDYLDPAMYQFIKNGDTEITVSDTMDFALHDSYVEATRKYAGDTRLGEKIGEIEGSEAGRPFPQEPSLDDPRAGEKLAWNYKNGYNWGDSAAIMPFYWKYRDMNSGKVERTVKFNFHFLNYTHRTQQEPYPAITPNPSNLFRGIYVQVLEPFDIKNTQLLIQRFDDDLKRDNAYLYLGFQRRVRRLSTGQVTDAFLGSDLMIEDFEGYNGRISDMNWTYKGTKTMLLPMYNHNNLELDTETHADDDGYQVVAFGGKGGCFPNIQWQLRKVYLLESDPVDPNHPISKREHYIDAQTFTIPRNITYDRKGDMWKSWLIGQAHPDYHLPQNKGTGVSIDDSFSMVDIQANHCTTGQFKGIVDATLTPESKMTVQNLRASGA
ncbi:MAG: DUF1329 domain-containing protein [Gammaproteobacteria bacterium]|uniref:DUF1329 domain-containing protein n=1 Tax=Pseudomaricurvus alcaniphilus TaxID=1166482 RepID=UPI0014075A36|nr:DUF1329 domain-containing protein [Pseudomaricurvus alcaniphilus]MBR9912788.1 DUF1329 domain-containing protein [Gammaproteobacteria bacterium]NHN37546.1 DUF1329 domain-containing protein [Pseudomaricurvus alcaniphilus]